jgi:hypothetical protein
MAALAQEGQIAPILAMQTDQAAQHADRTGADAATARMQAVEAMLLDLDRGSPQRAAAAARLGQEIAAGAGVLATLGAAIAVAMG